MSKVDYKTREMFRTFLEEPETAVQRLTQDGRLQERQCLGQALMEAARDGSPAVINAMIDQGADPSYQDHLRNSPLHVAVGEGKRNNTKALIKQGADVNAVNCIGKTPLGCAFFDSTNLDASWSARGRDPDVVISTATSLLAAGADPNTTMNGDTPLHHAESLEIAQTLLAAGANANAQDQWGNTPLHNAVNNKKNPEVVRALLTGGADPSIVNRKGQRADELINDQRNWYWSSADRSALDLVFLEHATQRESSPEQQSRRRRM